MGTKAENKITKFITKFWFEQRRTWSKTWWFKEPIWKLSLSVKLLDQSILNITGPDNYENEFELLAKISQKLNRIRNKSTLPLTTATSHHDVSINSSSTLPPGGPKLKSKNLMEEWQTGKLFGISLNPLLIVKKILLTLIISVI